MKIYDISLTITPSLPTWPGDPSIVLERTGKIEEGANANVSRIDMGVHTGTHVDAPFHFIPGTPTIESLPLDVLVGPVEVVQFPESVEVIHQQQLEDVGIPDGTERLLLKTRNSSYWATMEGPFQTGFVGIEDDAARYLVERGIRLVGIDYLSIAPYKRSRPTHEVLLGARMVILEGVNLSQVEPGRYMLYCLPLKLGGSDGAPARAILIPED